MAPPKLCQPCLACLVDQKGLQTSEDPSEMTFHHHFTIESLKASTNSNCPICTLLWGQLEPLQAQIPQTPINKHPLTLLSFKPPRSFEPLVLEGSYQVTARINSDAITIDGPKQPSRVMFLLQPEDGAYIHDLEKSKATSSSHCHVQK